MTLIKGALHDILMFFILVLGFFSISFLPIFIVMNIVMYYITSNVWLTILSALTFTTLLCPIVSTTMVLIKTRGKLDNFNLILSYTVNNGLLYFMAVKVLKKILA